MRLSEAEPKIFFSILGNLTMPNFPTSLLCNVHETTSLLLFSCVSPSVYAVSTIPLPFFLRSDILH